MSQITKQIKYGQIKAMNFIIEQRNQFWKIMIQKCIQHIIKENMLLLKDSLEPQKINLQIDDFNVKKCLY